MEHPEFDWFDLNYRRDPKSFLSNLSRQAAIFKTKLGYAIMDREQSRKILREDVPISTQHISEAACPYLAERTKEPLLKRWGTEHVRLRAVLSRVLRARVIDDLRPRIRQVFNELLEVILLRGEADLVPDLYDPFVARVLAPILGIPKEDIPMVAGWVTTSAHWVNPLATEHQIKDIEVAWRKLEVYLMALLEERRNDLRDDLFSELIREMEGSSELEIIGIAAEMTRAGFDTTRRQLANTTYALISHPDQWESLRCTPTLASNAVEEGLRFAPIIHLLPRQMIEEKEVLGISAGIGSVFTVMPFAANFDPAACENPDKFDISRKQSPHFTFGFGSHSCVGAPLARMEMVEALTIIANRVKRFEINGDVIRSDVSEGWVPQSLPVKIIAHQI